MADFRQDPDQGYSKSAFDRVSRNPAAPLGMRQQARSFADLEKGDGAFRPDSFVDIAPTWYAGANANGTKNGWDTTFYQDFMNDRSYFYDYAMEKNDPSLFWKMFDPRVAAKAGASATGVAFFDDPKGEFEFGDIIVNGKVQKGQNLYKVFDRHTADTMMGELLLDVDEKGRLFAENSPQNLQTTIEGLRTENTELARSQKQAQQYQRDLATKEFELQQEGQDTKNVWGGIIGGVALGGGVGGMVGGPIGAAIGGIVLGVVGGVGAWANQDELREMTARAVLLKEKTDARYDGLDQIAAYGANAKEWAGLGMKMISPLSNSVHGLQEYLAGDIGDRDAAWYATDNEGNQIRSNAMTAFDLAASVGDGVLQFSSPVGRGLYMTNMGVTSLGGTAALGMGGGETFNIRKGKFDEYEGKEWFGAVGNVAIDAVQFGTAGLLGRAARHQRGAAAVTEKEVAAQAKQMAPPKSGRVGGPGGEGGVGRRLKDWGRSALKDEGEVLAGVRFGRNEAGDIVSARMSLTLLAPSEFLKWIPAGYTARKLRDASRGLTPDDLYNAAYQASMGGSNFRNAFINAYAEAGEEAAQAILEPMSVSETPTLRDIMEQAAYGAAGGFGMGMGSLNKMRQGQRQLEGLARMAHFQQTGTLMSDEDWNKKWAAMTPSARQKAAKRVQTDEKAFKELLSTATEGMRDGAFGGGLIAQKRAEIARRDQWEKGVAKANEYGGDALTLMGLFQQQAYLPNGKIADVKYDGNAAVLTFPKAVELLLKNATATKAKLKQAKEEGKQFAEQLAELPADATPGLREELQHKIEQRKKMELDLDGVDKWLGILIGGREKPGMLLKFYEQYEQATTVADRTAAIGKFNSLLRKVYRKKFTQKDDQGNDVALDDAEAELAKKAVELVFHRHPDINKGSYVAFMPQVDADLTLMGAHSTVYMDQGLLKALGADHDGDNAITAFEIYFDEMGLRDLRRGTQYIRRIDAQAVDDKGNLIGTEVRGGKPTWELQIDPPDAEGTFIRNFARSDMTDTEKGYVTDGLSRLRGWFHGRYVKGGVLEKKAFHAAFDEFEKNVLAGNENARATFVLKLFELNGVGIQEHSDSTNMPEIIRMWQQITAEWEEIARSFAAYLDTHRPDVPMSDAKHAPSPEDRTEAVNLSMRRANDIGHMMALLGQVSPERAAQSLHYDPFIQAALEFMTVDPATIAEASPLRAELAQLYREIGTGNPQTDAAEAVSTGSIEKRTISFLEGFYNAIPPLGDYVKPTALETMLVAANIQVPDITGNYNEGFVVENGTISLLQLMLKKSLMIEESIHAAADPDSDVKQRIARMKRLTHRSGKNSNTAALAVIEIFGDMTLHELVGDDSFFIGPNMTLRQLQTYLLTLDDVALHRQLAAYKRSPGYMSHRNVGDPPWRIEQLYAKQNPWGDGKGPVVTGLTMLVDALQTSVAAETKRREDEANKKQKTLRDGLKDLHAVLARWKEMYAEEIGRDAGGIVTDEATLEYVLRMRPQEVEAIAGLITDASALAVVRFDNGKWHLQNWFTEFLLETDVDKAMTKYFVYTRLAEWNVMAGTVDTKAVAKGEVDKATIEQMRGNVRRGRIKSRFLDVMFDLVMLEDNGFELRRFLKAAMEATSLEDLFETINSESKWIGDRAPLHPFNDALANYELNPSDVWSSGDPAVKEAENILKFQETMRRLQGKSKKSLERDTARQKNLIFLQNMKEALDWRENGPIPGKVKPAPVFFEKLALLEQTIRNRQMFPDAVGPGARDQATKAFQEMILRMHDKGKADPRVEPMGAALIQADTFGWGNGVRLEMDQMSSQSWDTVTGNLTKMVQGPVRIMLDDGTVTRIDMSDTATALEMLADNVTHDFAKTVLFPTVRDINNENNIRVYTDTEEQLDIAVMLEEGGTFANLFNESKDSKLTKAIRLIGLVEANIRQEANKTNDPDRASEGFYPIQNMINEFITAYATSTGRGRSERELESMRNQLFIDIAEALKTVSRTPKALHTELRMELKRTMRNRFGVKGTSLQELLRFANAGDKQMLIETVRDWMAQSIAYDALAFQEEHNDLLTSGRPFTAEELAAVEAKIKDNKEKSAKFKNTTELEISNIMFEEFDTVARMFRIRRDPDNPDADKVTMAAIADYLGNMERISRFESVKGPAVTVDANGNKTTISFSALIQKFRENLHDTGSVNDAFRWGLTEQEWDQLAEWCVFDYIGQRATRSAADTRMAVPILGKNVAELERLYDTSWTYLFDTLFDDQALRAMKNLGTMAGHTSEAEPLTVKEAHDALTGSLVSSNKIGKWNDRVPMTSQKARKVMDHSAVRVAVSTEGVDPIQLSAWTATGTPTFEEPPADTIVATDIVVGKGSTFREQLGTVHYLKLHNHYVKSIQLIPTDTSIPPEDLTHVAAVNTANKQLAASDLRLLNLDALDGVIQDIVADGKNPNNPAADISAGYTVKIEFVDVDLKPADPKYRNNAFFDGAGRDSEGREETGVIASLFFGTGGLLKQGEQFPLDSLTKAGQAFRVYWPSDTETVEAIEASTDDVATILSHKVAHMMRQRYNWGFLETSDMTAIYKYVKSRHVVIGRDPDTKEKKVMWSEDYITATARGETPLLGMTDDTGPELVGLSERVAITLLSGDGVVGVSTDPQRPALNIHDINPAPSLDMVRLEFLGLERIGEEISPRMVAGQVSLPSKAYRSKENPAGVRDRYAQKIEQLAVYASPKLTERMFKRDTKDGTFDIAEVNRQNLKLLGEMMTFEQAGKLLKKMGIPVDMMRDLDKLEGSLRVSARLGDLLQNNGVIWHYKQDAVNDLSKGLLGKQVLEGGFDKVLEPVYGDVVIIDLATIQDSTDTPAQALARAKAVVNKFANQGVAVVLTGSSSVNGLRQSLAQHMTMGGLDYERVANSDNFFTLITRDRDIDYTREALESSLGVVRSLKAKTMNINGIFDEWGAISEGVRVIDPDPDKSTVWSRVTQVLLPTNMLLGASRDNVYKLGMPGPGQDQFGRVAKRLSDFYHAGGRQRLLDMMGDYPPGTNIFRVIDEDTGVYEPGVKSKEDALDDFIAALDAGKHTISVGEEVMAGDLYFTATPDDKILIARVGFQLPDQEDKQRVLTDWAEPLDGTSDRQGELFVSFAPSKPEALQTVPPPFTVTEAFKDGRGMVVTGNFDLGLAMKVAQMWTGVKTTLTPMDPNERFASPLADNGVWMGSMTSTVGQFGKEGIFGLVIGMANMFAMTGIDFRHALVDLFTQSKQGTSRDKDEFEKAWNDIATFLDEWSRTDFGLSTDDVVNLLDTETAVNSWIREQLDGFVGYSGSGILKVDPKTMPAERRLLYVILMTLTLPGITTQMVTQLPGLLSVRDPKSEAIVQWMPNVMGAALDNHNYPQLRKMLFGMANARFTKSPDSKGELQADHWFDHSFNFYTRFARTKPDGSIEYLVRKGLAQLEVPIAADENHIMFDFRRNLPRPYSTHNARTLAAQRGRLVMKPPKVDKDGTPIPDGMDELFGDNTIRRFNSDAETIWEMVTSIIPPEKKHPSKNPWPQEQRHIVECDKILRRFMQPISRKGWKAAEKKAPGSRPKLNADVVKFLNKLGLDPRNDLIEVDYLVRQWFGAPGASPGQDSYVEEIDMRAYHEAVVAMYENIEKGFHPLHGAQVPLEHSMFWKKVYDANKSRADDDRWSPLKFNQADKKFWQRRRASDSEYAVATWDEWVSTLMGQMLDSSEEFMSMFRSALDGFWHTYQGMAPSYKDLAKSTSDQLAVRLMDSQTNLPYISLDPGLTALMRDPVIVDEMKLDWSALAGWESLPTLRGSKVTRISEFHKRRERQRKWLKGITENPPKKMSVMEYSRAGARYQESKRNANNFARGAVHLSIITRLADPALWTSAIGEVFLRNQLENVTNLVSGTQMGTRGKRTAQAAGGISWVREKLGMSGLDLRYSVDDIAAVEEVVVQLGSSNQWVGELIGELTYQTVVDPQTHVDENGQVVVGARSKGGRGLEKTAAMVARVFSDPRMGMRQKTIARHYMIGVMEHFAHTDSYVPVESLSTLMRQDPLWVLKNAPAAHQAGVNAVAQIRSTRNSFASNFIMSPVEGLIASESPLLNIGGHMLKIPFLFTRFNANAFLTLTGLDAVDQTLAMFMHGRQKPWLVRRLGATMHGEAFDSKAFDPMNFDDVIQSIDLSRAFVRGAITQTTFMMLGMMGANLGLGGDDEETRKRKRMARYLGLPYIYDPRLAQNDFRNRDAWFFDEISILNTWLKPDDETRAMAVPHWTLKQFMSPVKGIMQFFENGDPREIGYGFLDAISVLPYSALRSFKDADATASLLAKGSLEQAGIDPQEKQNNLFWRFVQIAGVYERALFENQFVNGIRLAFDEVDRNPWIEPQTDSDGNIQREEASRYPLPNRMLQQYKEGEEIKHPETGEVYTVGRDGWAYKTREFKDGYVHQYAESNAVFAFAMSLFSGTDSSYLRRNMVPKDREVPRQKATREQAEALLIAKFIGLGGQDYMTKDEIVQVLKAKYQAAGIWWNEADVNAEADAHYRRMSDSRWAMSKIDPNLGEVLTDLGGEALYKGLIHGTIDFDSAGLQGIFIPEKMRQRIADKWMDEMVQEGVELGLSESQSRWRAKRFWFGDTNNPGSSPGLMKIISDTRIPTEPTAGYTQLQTTYAIGPDGLPWPTPFTRKTLSGVLGIPMPHKMVDLPESMKFDARGNAVDTVKGINTGRAALAPKAKEPVKIKLDDPVKKTEEKRYVSDKKFAYRGFGAYRRGYGYYGRGRGYSRGGGGSWGGGGSGSAYFNKMSPLGYGTSARPADIPFINTGTPYIRRANVQKQRFQSERGRLKQWQ